MTEANVNKPLLRGSNVLKLCFYAFFVITMYIHHTNIKEENKQLAVLIDANKKAQSVLDSIKIVQQEKKIADLRIKIDCYVDSLQKRKHPENVTKFLTNEFLESVIRNSSVVPSVVLSQSALETGWGKRKIGNNIFGIKGKDTIVSTREFIEGHYCTQKLGFRLYEDIPHAITDHNRILKTERYGIEDFNDTDEVLEGIDRGGYATEPNYTRLLKSIIRRYKLNEIDKIYLDYHQV